MNSELKAFIYEAYNRGDIDGESVKDIIGDVDEADIVEAAYLAADAEITEAENIFIETAMNYAAGNVDIAVFENKAEGVGAKIKAAWEKFKKWVKSALDKLKKKLFDFTGTFYVDKSKWTRMQKLMLHYKKLGTIFSLLLISNLTNILIRMSSLVKRFQTVSPIFSH